MSIQVTESRRLPVRRDGQIESTKERVLTSVVGGYSGGVSSNHNLLSGLQGGTTGEYYHLTQSDYNKVVGFGYPSAGIVVSTGSAWGTSLSISNNTNDYVVTMTGSGFNGETNLRFDGNDLYIKSGYNKGVQFQNGDINYGKVGGNSYGVVIWSADGNMSGRFYNGIVYFNGNVQFMNYADTLEIARITDTGYLSVGRDITLNSLHANSDVAIYFYSYALSTTKSVYWDDYNPSDTLGNRGLSLIDTVYVSNYGNVGVGTFNPLAKLHVDGNIYGTSTVQNPSFVSGFQGDKWRITAEGDAEFESLFVRGALTVYELLINQLHYQNGGLIIGAGAGKIRSIYNSTQGSEKLYFQDPTGNNYTPFSVGAIVMVQHVDINRSTVVKKIVRQVSAIQSDLRVDLTTTSGWPTSSDVGVFEEGDEVCTIGHVSDSNYQNSIYLSAIDSNNPFMRVLAGVDSYGDWSLSNKSCVKLQIGNLDSLASYDILPASPGYGLYCANAYLTGRIVLPNAGMTNEGSSDSDIRIWAGESYANRATAPFRITQDGSLTATGVAEIGTETASYGGKISNIAIKNADIWENSYNSNWSGLHINRIGYNGGTSYYREFKVYDGKGNSMFGTAYCVSGLQFFCYAPALFDGTQFVCNSYAYFNEVQINKLHMINYLYLNGTLVGADGVPKELPYIIKKKASYTTRNSNDSEVSQNYVDYVCKKVIRFDNGIIGQFRVYFELKFQKYTGEGTTAYGQIYKNGVPYGTVRSTTNNYYTSFYEDFTDDLAPGDTIELWLKTDDYIGDDYAYARYLRIQYDNDPTIAVTTTNDP